MWCCLQVTLYDPYDQAALRRNSRCLWRYINIWFNFNRQYFQIYMCIFSGDACIHEVIYMYMHADHNNLSQFVMVLSSMCTELFELSHLWTWKMWYLQERLWFQQRSHFLSTYVTFCLFWLRLLDISFTQFFLFLWWCYTYTEKLSNQWWISWIPLRVYSYLMLLFVSDSHRDEKLRNIAFHVFAFVEYAVIV